jgi:hypothetical protein
MTLFLDYEEPTETTCKRCGKPDLNWQHDGETWVLMEGKYKVHKCAGVEDDFDAIV